MKIVSWDLETFKIMPGMAAPRMVCLSWDDGETSGVVLREEGLAMLRAWLVDPDVLLIGQYLAYDLGVAAAEDFSLLPLIYRAIETKRVRCTLMREKLIAIAKGELKYEWDEEEEKFIVSKFDLQRIVYRRLGRWIKKKEEYWRLHYGLLDGVPVAEWPREAYDYALGDAVDTRLIFLSQEDEILADEGEADGVLGPDGFVEIPGEILEVKASTVLNLKRIWGVRTNRAAVAAFKTELQADYDKQVKIALEHGLMRMTKKKGQLVAAKTMSAIYDRVVEHYNRHGLKVPFTNGKKPKVSTTRDTLKNARHRSVTPDPGLDAVAEVGRFGKLLTTYVPILESGVSRPITPEYNTPIDSGRTSCRRPNIQNGPRATQFRPCFVPRPGSVFVFADYDTLEMRTLAQTCIDFFGYSDIAEAIKAGRDLHVDLASELMKLTYEEALALYEAGDKETADMRQVSKPGNYGAAGGMGADSFVDFCRSQGIFIEIGLAKKVLEAFRKKWSEMEKYFLKCSNLCSTGGEAERVAHPRTGFVRGFVPYTATCNHFFQHLAAWGAKHALWRASKEMYVGEDIFDEDGTWLRYEPGALHGCRGFYFGHDEIGMEVPIDRIGAKAASAAAERLSLVMREEMQTCVPDVPIGATAVMTRSWLKGAKPVRLDGLLVPCRREGKDWVADLGDEERAAA